MYSYILVILYAGRIMMSIFYVAKSTGKITKKIVMKKEKFYP